jgi:transcriptional repressor NrdR
MRREGVGAETGTEQIVPAGSSAAALLESGGDECDVFDCDVQPMRCPYCGFAQDRVVDSRESKEADSIRRRRECERCNKRFTTYERIDEIPYMVVKKDGRREKFDRQKILGGLLHACQKRPVPGAALERIVDETEAYVVDSADRERTTREVGELIMSRLKDIDTVAYIRFASVYRDFKDVREFKAELEELLSGRDTRKKPKL